MSRRNKLYFEKINPLIPMIHRNRYLLACDGPHHMRPPICLRYAMWTLASTVSDTYNNYKDVFYQRSRMYAEMDESKGLGEHFVTTQHAQCWILLGNYEVRSTAFPRAWVNSGRSTRLVQMMGLHRLDGDVTDFKRAIPEAKDWIELEERRRTFWGAFCSDRWSSAGTGWPMSFHEQDVSGQYHFIRNLANRAV